MEQVLTFISEHSTIAIVIIAVLLIVIIIVAAVSSSRRKKILALTSNRPGKILETLDGDYIVVSPRATLIDLKSNESFKVYQILDKIWEDVGKKLAEFYDKPFEIHLKICDLKKGSKGYSIIVSDKNDNLYLLKTNCLPAYYNVKIQPFKSDKSKD